MPKLLSADRGLVYQNAHADLLAVSRATPAVSGAIPGSLPDVP
jgi:hypothetical protein